MNQRARTDSAASDADRASRIIRRVRTAYDAAYPTKADLDLVSETFKRADGYTYRGIKREHVSALGVEPLINSSTQQLAEKFIAENVALIEDLPDKQLRDIEKDVLEAIANGERAESISRAIRERSGMARRRADLIARDQMGKAVSQLNQKRMQELGFDKYIWRTVGDERVRPEHQMRDGKVFSWSDPPEDGHPGEPINCRCSAEPVFEDVLKDLGVDDESQNFNQQDPVEWDLQRKEASAASTIFMATGNTPGYGQIYRAKTGELTDGVYRVSPKGAARHAHDTNDPTKSRFDEDVDAEEIALVAAQQADFENAWKRNRAIVDLGKEIGVNIDPDDPSRSNKRTRYVLVIRRKNGVIHATPHIPRDNET